jgi:predicted outer membrane repeat protein
LFSEICLGPINISSSLFHNNSATFNKGGAIYTSSCGISLLDSIMTDNTATEGGALYSNKDPASLNVPSTELIDCECSGNTASNDYGGCLVADSVLLRLQGGSYIDNVAPQGECAFHHYGLLVHLGCMKDLGSCPASPS